MTLNSKTTNNPIKKTGKGPEYTVFQRRHTGDRQANDKMLHVTNHQENASQNHNFITSNLLSSKRQEIASVGKDVLIIHLQCR